MIETIHVDSLIAIGDGGHTLTSGNLDSVVEGRPMIASDEPLYPPMLPRRGIPHSTSDLPVAGVRIVTERRVIGSQLDIQIDPAAQRAMADALGQAARALTDALLMGGALAAVAPKFPLFSPAFLPYAPEPAPPFCASLTNRTLSLLTGPGAASTALWALRFPRPPRYVGPRRAARRRHHRRLKRR